MRIDSSDPIRLLLVEDDVVDRRIVTRALSKAGVEADVVELDTAEPVLSLLLRDRAAFDCGVFDLRLPDRDGLELLEELRAAGCEIPIIFLTGQGSEDVAVDLMKAGASDYLPKSQLTPSRLRKSILQAIRVASTERRQREAEAALRESEASFRRLAESLPDVVARFDRLGKHVYLNHPVPWSQAATTESMLGRTIAEGGFDPDRVAPLEAALALALAGEPSTVTVNLPAPAGDAFDDDDEPEPRWIEVRFVPERDLSAHDSASPPRTVLALCRDVTRETLRAEEDAQRREFERQLVAIVSHDLRNPIGAMLVATQALERLVSVDGEDPVARSLAVLKGSGQRAERMVSDILDFTQARLGGSIPMRFADCDLVSVFEQVLLEERTANPQRSIEHRLTGDRNGRGRFDADRIAQALSNLVRNAIRYSPSSEAVTVELAGDPDYVTLSVRNRGETIPEETIPLLFRPFQRGSRTSSGANPDRSVGLGLFIVEQIVRGHRGKIDVSSADGLTMFRMRLPRRPDRARARRITRIIPAVKP